MRRTSRPAALTIAGSDSGGGAGIQADLHTFAALGVHGTSALTCLTAQNPSGVTGIQACRPGMVRQQIEAVLDGFAPTAIKTGMLYSAAIVTEVSECLSIRRPKWLVVDPVMVATSGAVLLQPAAIRALREQLMPRADLITPNLHEAALLTGRTLRSVEDLRLAGRELHRAFGCAVLAKGAHLSGLNEAVDLLFDGRQEWMLTAPMVRGVSTHGTGCTYSAAVTALLATGNNLAAAVRGAKEFITGAIAWSILVGRHSVLNWSWRRRSRSGPRG